MRETLRNEHSLPLSARQLAKMARHKRPDLKSIDCFIHNCAIRGSQSTEDSAIGEAAHGHHFANRHRQLIVDLRRLQHVRNFASCFDRVVTQNTQRSGLHRQQADDRVEQTRFSGAVRTNQ